MQLSTTDYFDFRASIFEFPKLCYSFGDMNKQQFEKHEQEDVRQLIADLTGQRDAIEEELKQQPDDDALRDALEDCEEGLEALAPVLLDYERAGVDSEELVKYAEMLSDWHEKSGEIAELLKK